MEEREDEDDPAQRDTEELRDEDGDGDAEKQVAKQDDRHGRNEEADDDAEVEQRLLGLNAGQRHKPGDTPARRRKAREDDPADCRNGPLLGQTRSPAG